VLELGVLADDLTGGMMIASLIELEGVVCPLATAPDALPTGGEAVVLARKIRLIDPDEARREARGAAAAFARLGARRVYSKYSALFDSTRRGNIGPIAEALLAATGAERTVFCPAYVERGVTIQGGQLMVGPTPLAQSFKRNDPATPAWTSDLVDALQAQTELKVARLPREALDDAAQLAREAAPFLIADAIDLADIDRLAAFVLDWPLITGADSLAPALARAWRRGAAPDPNAGRRLLPPSPGFEAVIAGSCAPQTLAQLAEFEREHALWRIDLARDADDPDLASRILVWAGERLSSGPIGVATSAGKAGVAAAQARFGRGGAAERADRLLAEVAVGLARLGARKFVVAGGETSGAVLGALQIRTVEVAAYGDLFGGYCHQAGPEPMSLVLKAGSIGGPDFLDKALGRMREADAHQGGLA
jgi:3-dehydrotetronate 4-kinase